MVKRADSDADAKKAKHRVFRISVTVVAPEDVSPVTLVLDAATESKRALRQAKDAATNTLHINKPRGAGTKEEYRKLFELFAKPFGAAVASACANEEGPVSMTKVITAIADTGCELKIGKDLKERFVWDGFKAGWWEISSHVMGKGLVVLKVSPKDKNPKRWKFSPLGSVVPIGL